MSEQLRTKMEQLIEREKLPSSFYSLAARYYLPLSDVIAATHKQTGRPWMVGVNGAQGTGKSTLGHFLELFLQHKHGLNCVCLSIDDMYYTRAEREQLAVNTHPLLITRGVPGTHDLALGISVCEQLLAADEHSETRIPRFNKAIDDRLPIEQWSVHRGKTDVLLLEGWCVGNRPQPPDTLGEPINALERDEDPDCRWRRYANIQLQYYQRWFKKLDQLIMLKAPSMAAIYNWRNEQEAKLAASFQGETNRIMSSDDISRFVQHYERLTTYALQEMPQRADCVFHLNEAHNITQVSGPLAPAMGFTPGSDHAD